ncbi:MAG TPA: peptide chain release factor N(5)-glutamine methyltransferase [Candidatus Rubrimentiphilum sp.]|nr:peptide chain release factor N(5)-glutamine methyltransferase [Candidatus Rubrimentiphilum sp.]
MNVLGYPEAYKTGWKGFYRREFAVNKDVLVPRPETEHLVEEAIEFLRTQQKHKVLDVGTGSGAIACTIAAEVSSAIVDATDISVHAFEVARRNAERIGVIDRCRFILADIAQPGSRYDLIVANLPYIPTADVPRKPDPVAFEPRVAVDGGADGLEQYRKLLAIAPALSNPSALLLLEAAPPTMHALRTLAAAAFPGAQLSVGFDYSGLERFLRIFS